jgi:hypothetical protein
MSRLAEIHGTRGMNDTIAWYVSKVVRAPRANESGTTSASLRSP